MAKTSKKIIGLDVGGTKTAIGLIEEGSWKVLKFISVPTNAKNGRKEVLTNTVRLTKNFITKGVYAVGLGFAGLTDIERGILVKAPNFPSSFNGFRIAAAMKKEVGLPVFLDNDVHCFALAEAKIGAGRGKNTVFGMTLGTGIGGGLVVNGSLYRGRDNAAGEVGHLELALGSNATCGCGQKGHFEAIASGSAMTRFYAECTGMVHTASQIVELAAGGDRAARDVVERFRNGLAAGLATIAYAYNPDIIVIGGGLAKDEAAWRPAVTAAEGQIIFPRLSKLPVRRSRLGVKANVIGAAMIASQMVKS